MMSISILPDLFLYLGKDAKDDGGRFSIPSLVQIVIECNSQGKHVYHTCFLPHYLDNTSSSILSTGACLEL